MQEINRQLEQAVAGRDLDALRQEYLDQGEALVIEEFLPAPLLLQCQQAVRDLQPRLHRNYLPGHKKGGSISRHLIDRQAPLLAAIYRAPALWRMLGTLTGEELVECPASDPHTYALYYYTEPGDHIGWHYDTSYYKGKRFTLLFGMIDDSSSRLECVFNRGDADRERTLSLALKPGTFVLFNGDRLWHRVTPLGENELRVVLTMEYVTSVQMNPVSRFVSDMKDSLAYFGFSQVFGRKKASNG